MLYAILDAVVDEYRPVVDGLSNDIDEIETQVFDGDAAVSRRIYELSREVIDFERAVNPLTGIIETLSQEVRRRARRGRARDLPAGRRRPRGPGQGPHRGVPRAAARHPAGQRDPGRRAAERGGRARSAPRTCVRAEETRKISGWAAILFAPSLIGSIYGMNFVYMPELDWYFGYPFAIGLMAATSFTLYIVFKRRGWL